MLLAPSLCQQMKIPTSFHCGGSHGLQQCFGSGCHHWQHPRSETRLLSSRARVPCLLSLVSNGPHVLTSAICDDLVFVCTRTHTHTLSLFLSESLLLHTHQHTVRLSLGPPCGPRNSLNRGSLLAAAAQRNTQSKVQKAAAEVTVSAAKVTPAPGRQQSKDHCSTPLRGQRLLARDTSSSFT